MKKAKNIDSYLAEQSTDLIAKLEKLRQTIKATAPGTEEVISYGMPAFKYNGKMLVGFAAFKKHIGFYPWNGHTLAQFKDDLKDYHTSSGAIQFAIEKPIPVTLVKKIVKARVKENLKKNEVAGSR